MTLQSEPKSQWSSIVATEQLDRCPNCGATCIAFWTSGRDRLLGVTRDVFEYSKCQACGVIFESVRPMESAIGTFYTEGYQPHRVRASKKDRSERGPKWRINLAAMGLADRISGARAFRAELARFYECLKRAPVVLDFGCGSTTFLDRARKFSCRTIGMDFSQAVLVDVAKRGHQALGVGDADWDRIEDNTIDVVRMNHVIEHLYDPARTLQRLHGKMASGAVIHLATPNAESSAADTYREHWWSLECPRHIIIFNPSALEKMLASVGFGKIRIVQEPVTKDLARSAIARDMDAGREPMQDVNARASDGLLNLRFAVSGRLAAWRARSDRIHAFAAKGSAS